MSRHLRNTGVAPKAMLCIMILVNTVAIAAAAVAAAAAGLEHVDSNQRSLVASDSLSMIASGIVIVNNYWSDTLQASRAMAIDACIRTGASSAVDATHQTYRIVIDHVPFASASRLHVIARPSSASNTTAAQQYQPPWSTVLVATIDFFVSQQAMQSVCSGALVQSLTLPLENATPIRPVWYTVVLGSDTHATQVQTFRQHYPLDSISTRDAAVNCIFASTNSLASFIRIDRVNSTSTSVSNVQFVTEFSRPATLPSITSFTTALTVSTTYWASISSSSYSPDTNAPAQRNGVVVELAASQVLSLLLIESPVLGMSLVAVSNQLAPNARLESSTTEYSIVNAINDTVSLDSTSTTLSTAYISFCATDANTGDRVAWQQVVNGEASQLQPIVVDATQPATIRVSAYAASCACSAVSALASVTNLCSSESLVEQFTVASIDWSEQRFYLPRFSAVIATSASSSSSSSAKPQATIAYPALDVSRSLNCAVAVHCSTALPNAASIVIECTTNTAISFVLYTAASSQPQPSSFTTKWVYLSAGSYVVSIVMDSSSSPSAKLLAQRSVVLEAFQFQLLLVWRQDDDAQSVQLPLIDIASVSNQDVTSQRAPNLLQSSSATSSVQPAAAEPCSYTWFKCMGWRYGVIIVAMFIGITLVCGAIAAIVETERFYKTHGHLPCTKRPHH
jgi:hypothetical protein